MTKFLLVIGAIALLVFGYMQYQKRKDSGLGALSTPQIIVENNVDLANADNVNAHCMDANFVNEITNKSSYQLTAETYTAAVQLLNCTYISNQMVDNVTPSVTYKKQFTRDANGFWTRKQTAVKKNTTYQVSNDYPNGFADANPVHEIDQTTFYGKGDGIYVELTYTPVAEGMGTRFETGMKLLQKALSN